MESGSHNHDKFLSIIASYLRKRDGKLYLFLKDIVNNSLAKVRGNTSLISCLKILAQSESKILKEVSDGMSRSPQAVKDYLLLPVAEQITLLERSFPLLLKQAGNDNVYAMGILSQYYQSGLPPVERDHHEMRKWDARCTDWSRRHGEM